MRRQLVVWLALVGSASMARADYVDDLLRNLTHPFGYSTRFAFSNDHVYVETSAPRPFDGTNFKTAQIVVGRPSDGKAAWIAADITSDFTSTGCMPYPCSGAGSFFHTAGLVERVGERWQWVAYHAAPPVTREQQAQLIKEKIVPDAIERSVAGAEDVVKVFEASIGDAKALAATVSDRAEVVLYGSEPGERVAGGAKAKARLLVWNLSLKVRDGIQAGVTSSKSVAWVAANVNATSPARPKAPAAQYRVLAIYEKTPAAWKLVQLSFSVDTDPQ